MRHKLKARTIETLAKPGRYADGGGLYFKVVESKRGLSRAWVFLFQRDGKRSELGLGPYPAVILADARGKAAELQARLARGEDIRTTRKPAKIITFGDAADAFLSDRRTGWSADHAAQTAMFLNKYAAPVRSQPVAEVSTENVLAVLKPIWTAKPETANRVRARIESVLDYAKVRGWRTGENPAGWRGHLAHILAPPRKLARGHHAALPYDEVPAVLTAIKVRKGQGAPALAFLILTAARSTEVRHMRWRDLDMGAALWTVPADCMKARREHRVPLSAPALAFLAHAAENGADPDALVWPGFNPSQPISERTLDTVLKRIGVPATVHGFRSTFRDWAGDKTTFPRDVAEEALAHIIPNATERAYRRSDALEKRRKLMEQWGDYCAGMNAKAGQER